MPDELQSALLAGTVAAMQAIADALIARDPGLRVAIEERLEEQLARLAVGPPSHPGAAMVQQMLLKALRSTSRERPPQA